MREELEEFLCAIDEESLSKDYENIEATILKFVPELTLIKDVTQENKHHIYNVLKHTLYSIAYSKKDKKVRVVLLLHDIGKGKCKTIDEKGVAHFYLHPLKSKDLSYPILKRLGYEEKEIKEILSLIKNHDRQLPSKKAIRKLLKEMKKEEVLTLLEVKKGDAKGQNPEFLEPKLQAIEYIKENLTETI
ncbi:MAG: HD domain-containing protein [Clostridium sp.]|uniref:HD domain-containing protein n=1 Tax=Clostridium sp. TaxID=1506 RepID=UPI003F3690E5